MNMFQKILIFGSALLLSSFASGDILANYTFPQDEGNEFLDQANAANMSASDFTGGFSNMIQLGTAQSTSEGQSIFVRNSQFSAQTEADSISGDVFWGFTVTPDSGYLIDLDNLTFDLRKDGAGTMDYGVYSSVGGFTAGNAIQSGQVSFGDGWVGQNINLSGAAFQGLTTATEFRVYIWRDDTSSTGRINRADSFVLNGEVSLIPEPGTLALVGLALGSLLLFRHKR